MVKKFIKELCKGLCRSWNGIGFWLSALSSILLLALPAFDWGRKVNEIMAIMSLSSRLLIVFGFIFVSVILTSYSVYKKQEGDKTELQKENDDLQDSLKKLKDAERESLKRRLAPIIKKITDLMNCLNQNKVTHSFLSDKAINFIIQKWLNAAGISRDDQDKYFGCYTCLPNEEDLVRDCYVLLYVEDWVSDTHLDWLYRDARSFFLGCTQEMEKTTSIKTDTKITTSASFDFFYCLARDSEEILDPTDIVMRVEKALMNVKNYLDIKGLWKEKGQ